MLGLHLYLEYFRATLLLILNQQKEALHVAFHMWQSCLLGLSYKVTPTQNHRMAEAAGALWIFLLQLLLQ